MNIEVKESEYKKRPILEFWDKDYVWGPNDTPRPFLSFGVKKAAVILGNIPAIKEFLETYREES